MEVGINDGEVKRGDGDVERSCYCIHAPIHKTLSQAKAVFHTHMPFASALTRLEDPHIKEIGQTEVGMMELIAYDDNYTGPAFDPAEGERLAKVLGNKTVLFMANHGVTTVGQSVADAYNRLYYIERAAQVQIYALWTGQRLKQLPQTVIGFLAIENAFTRITQHSCAAGFSIWPMSVQGQERRIGAVRNISAPPPRADVERTSLNRR